MSDPYAGATYGANSRSSQLDHVLATLLRQAPDLEAAAVVSFDGLPMASALPAGMDEDRVAAMSAALLSLGERAAQGLGRGDLSQVYVEGDNGTVFLVSADDEAVLVAVGRYGAKVGLMLFEVKQAAEAVATCLRAEPESLAPPLVAVVAQPIAEPVLAPVPEQTHQPAAEPVLQPVLESVSPQVAPSLVVPAPVPTAIPTPVPTAPTIPTIAPVSVMPIAQHNESISSPPVDDAVDELRNERGSDDRVPSVAPEPGSWS